MLGFEEIGNMPGTSLAIGMHVVLTHLPSHLWIEQDWDLSHACWGPRGRGQALQAPAFPA